MIRTMEQRTKMWKSQDKRDSAGGMLEGVIMDGLTQSLYYFNEVNTSLIEELLNSTIHLFRWRVYRVGRNKIVAERVDRYGVPMYRTWVMWKNYRCYTAYSSKDRFHFQKVG